MLGHEDIAFVLLEQQEKQRSKESQPFCNLEIWESVRNLEM
jgi:hypothetical protein